DVLARGYLGSPALTADRFIPDPFADRPGTRLYRTGDLAKYLHDGTLEFLGRKDRQVKVRGFRIELGEIEALLSEHNAVREAVVLAQDNARGDKRLVAYLRMEDSTVTDDELREFLRRRLPEYMLPSAMIRLAELPLSANGKIDYGALTALGKASSPSRGEFVAPRTSEE